MLVSQSPLKPQPVKIKARPARSQIPVDRVSIQDAAEKPVAQSSSRWRKWGMATALGLSLVSSAAAFSGPGQVLVQQLFNPNAAPDLTLVEQLQFQGYAGEAAVDRSGVIEVIQDNFSLFDAPPGDRRDGKIGVSDLQRVAADDSLTADVAEAAQALLADPLLMRSLDVAHGRRVDHVISRTDLRTALSAEEQGDFGSFDEVRQRLETPLDGQSAFEFFDSLGRDNDKFGWDELHRASMLEVTPDPFRQLADELLANPNYMNAFDVASASGSGGLLSHFDSAQFKDGIVSADDLQNIAYAPLPEVGRQFSPDDQLALDRILSGQSEVADNLISAFRQTDRGNCASTAVIKAALDRYGTGIFDNVVRQDDGSYLVSMQDGFQLQISPSELEAAATAASYRGSERETRSLATLAYASMAKRAWMMKHEGAQTYGQALLSLNNGENTLRVPAYLGLGERVQKISIEEVSSHDGAVSFGGGHAYYVDQVDGQTLGDKWGQAVPYKGLAHVDEGGGQKGAFILLP